MPYVRRLAATLAALTLVIGVAACATTVAGSGQAAPDGATGAPGPTVGSTFVPPTLSLPPGQQVPNPDIPDSPCDVPSDAELHVYGDATNINKKLDECEMRASDGRSLKIVHYSSLTLAQQKRDEPGGKDTTIAGLPAYITKYGFIIVGRSKIPTNRGILMAYIVDPNDTAGQLIATGLLEKIAPRYQY